jgi:hypothetical protein
VLICAEKVIVCGQFAGGGLLETMLAFVEAIAGTPHTARIAAIVKIARKRA